MAIAASKDADFYLKRGRLYADKGKLERAAAEYTRAIQLRPDFATAYIRRAEVYRAKGNLERALEDLTKAVELNPPKDAPLETEDGSRAEKLKSAMSAAGGWKGLIDCEKLKREIYEARENSLRAYKP